MSTHSHGPYTRPLFVCVSLLPHRYWPIRPLATCTAWIAIDDSREDNGALQVIPGSHTARTLLHHEHRDDPEHLALDLALPTTSFDHARAVTLTLEPGQVSFHDVFLVHGSEPNRSSRSRRGMTVRFMPTTSVYNHTSASSAARLSGSGLGCERREQHRRPCVLDGPRHPPPRQPAVRCGEPRRRAVLLRPKYEAENKL